MARSQIPDIRVQLQKLLEPREPLAATRVVTDADQYVVLDAIREDAVARHETLVDRMERRVFDLETSRETLRTVRSWTNRAARAFPAADHMRAVTLELADRDAAKTAYRELIALYADRPLNHPETLRGVAWAQEAIERLTPVPRGHTDEQEFTAGQEVAREAGVMDFGRFEGFWQRFARERLGVQEGITVEAILVRVLRLGRSCVVCNLLQSRSFDVISRWQYVLAEDSAGRMEFLRRHTWCNRHGWRFKALASPRELGRLHRQLMAAPQARIGELLGQDLEQLRAQSSDRILQHLVGDRVCPLCQDEAALQGNLLDALARGLASGALRMAFTESAGCCLPHLAAVLALVPDAETARFLLETTRERLGRLAADLDTYEAEAQSRRREFGSAADAPSRAMDNWVGLQGTVRDVESGRLGGIYLDGAR